MTAPVRVPVEGLGEGEGDLGPAAYRYAVVVRRLRAGDAFVAFDPVAAREADAVVVAERDGFLLARVGELRDAPKLARVVVVLQGIAKGDKLDAIVRDATELGAAEIWPIACERSVGAPSTAKLERWRRIAREAARQSGRPDEPVVREPCSLQQALAQASPPGPLSFAGEGEETSHAPSPPLLQRRGGLGGEACAIALHPAAERSFRAAFELAPDAARVLLAIGPEGGFSPAELALLDDAGFARARLGAFTMRTETAAAAALGALAALTDA